MKHYFMVVFFSIYLFSLSQNPSLVWAKSQSGTFDDYNTAIITDPSGNVYVSGYFQGTPDFDPGPGSYTLTSKGGYDFFVSKLDGNGNFIWAKSVGGSFQDFANTITLDALGNVLISGYYQDTVDFNPGVGTFTLASNGSDDFYILKLDGSGNFIWATSVGGPGKDWGISLTTDATNNIYLGGTYTFTVDFNPGATVFNMISAGLEDVFVLKLDPLGNFVWAKSINGASNDNLGAITVDPLGNLIATGSFKGVVDFDPSLSTYTLSSSGNTDVFVSKFDLAGNFIWAEKFGSINQDEGYSLKCDASGNIHIVGLFQSNVDFDPSPLFFNVSAIGSADIFILKLNSGGNFVWAKNIGGPSVGCGGYSISLDPSGNVYTGGIFNGTVDFNPGVGTFNIIAISSSDAFVSKLDVNGNFVWARSIGSSGFDLVFSINTDLSGNLYIANYSNGTEDLDPSATTTFTLPPSGSMDSYVLKWAQSTTGLNSFVLKETSFVYPNPFQNKFSIVLDKSYANAEVTIRDVTGRLVYESKIKNVETFDFALNEESGLYFLTISSEENVSVFKLIKE